MLREAGEIIPYRSHERFIEQPAHTEDHDAHCKFYFRLRALYALRHGQYGTYEYWRVRAGDHIDDASGHS